MTSLIHNLINKPDQKFYDAKLGDRVVVVYSDNYSLGYVHELLLDHLNICNSDDYIGQFNKHNGHRNAVLKINYFYVRILKFNLILEKEIALHKLHKLLGI